MWGVAVSAGDEKMDLANPGTKVLLLKDDQNKLKPAANATCLRAPASRGRRCVLGFSLEWF